MRKFAAMAGLMLAAASLGGCQSIFGSTSAGAETGRVDMADYYQLRLDTGRANLAAGRPASAIVAFRQASYDARFAGEAYNGMAIAFDQIGRADLAARYFARAMAAAPGDERFVRNLAKFEARTGVALATAPVNAPVAAHDGVSIQAPAQVSAELPAVAAQVAAPPAVAEASNTLRGPVRVERAPATRVLRVAQGQVTVGAQRVGQVTRMAEQAAKPARVWVQPRSDVRTASGQVMDRARRGAQARKAYPIRFVLRSDRNHARP